MSLMEEALKLAIEYHLPSRVKEYKYLSIDEVLDFMENNLTLGQIEDIQVRTVEIMKSDLRFKYPIEYGEFDESVPLPKFDELEDPSPYNSNQAGYANGKDDD